jgi:hypothetical protein
VTLGESIAARVPAPGTPVRGTQLLVEHMGEVFRRPSLTGLEILWRWTVGIPVLWVCWLQVQRILAAYPLANSGWNSIDTENPWVAMVQLVNVWSYYSPHVLAVLRWLVPAAALVWSILSGIGRNLVLRRLHQGLAFRPVSMILLQAIWLGLLSLTLWAWFASMQWVAATHISASGEPELVSFFNWSIFLSLGFFAGFGLVSWVVSVAPLLMLLERRSAFSALGQSFRLGKRFTSKLVEINLVMGIANLALIVLAMVFSAAPLPFSDEMGPGLLHMVVAGATVFYIVGDDYFQVVRLEAFVEFWKIFRGQRVSAPAS